jgi:hypothetical protein
MVEPQPSKLMTRVRFPSPAPSLSSFAVLPWQSSSKLAGQRHAVARGLSHPIGDWPKPVSMPMWLSGRAPPW